MSRCIEFPDEKSLVGLHIKGFNINLYMQIEEDETEGEIMSIFGDAPGIYTETADKRKINGKYIYERRKIKNNNNNRIEAIEINRLFSGLFIGYLIVFIESKFLKFIPMPMTLCKCCIDNLIKGYTKRKWASISKVEKFVGGDF